MDRQIISGLLKTQGLSHHHSIDKIEIGFTNSVYSIDDQYIRFPFNGAFREN